MKLIRNSVGMGLVEVMMAVAVTGGLTLTIAKLMDNAGQGAKQVEAKTENTNLKGIVQDTLNNPTACKNTFNLVMTAANVTTLSGSPTATVNVPSIRDKTTAPGAIKYSIASTNINPLTITSMELTNYNAAAFTGDLIINSTFNKSHSIVQMVKPIRIPINFSFVAGAFNTCSTMAVGGEWMMNGNAGTNPASDYIGTSDNQPLNFRVNSQMAGKVDSASATYFGYQAGLVTTGLRNTAIGYQALTANTTGNNNTSIGNTSLMTNSSGQENIAIGVGTLRLNTTANWNVGVGNYTLQRNTIGISNVGFGGSVMSYNVDGSDNVAMGYGSLYTNVSGKENVAMGTRAGSAVSNNHNVAIGYEAMVGGYSGPNIGTENTAIGKGALHNTRNGFNSAIGAQAGAYNDTGEYNTFVGYKAGAWGAAITGSRNVFLGAFAGANSTGTNTTNSPTANDKLYINNGVSNVSLIEGDFSSAGRYVTINGKLGVGTSTPGTPSAPVNATAGVTKLHVTGGKTILDQEAWIALPLAAGWAPCQAGSSYTPSYFKSSTNIVHIKGCIMRTGTSTGSGLAPDGFYVPAGYRPDAIGNAVGGMLPKEFNGQICALYYGSPGVFGISGVGSTFATNERCYMTGVSYRADY